MDDRYPGDPASRGATARRFAAWGFARLRRALLPRALPRGGIERLAPPAGSPSLVASAPGQIRRLPVLPRLTHQGRTNDCGPHALAMAASCYWPGKCDPADAARRLRPFRLPGVGATMPWGIVLAGRWLGLAVRGHWFGKLADLKRCVDAGHPAIVVVHPDDFAGTPWYSLHYRVVVGYLDDPALPGGGELYFACSGAWAEALPGGRPGNVAVSYARFRRQWHTWATVYWYAELAPR